MATLSIYVSDDLVEKLRDLAEAEHRSVSNMVTVLLSRILAEEPAEENPNNPVDQSVPQL
jgi:predicted transcriptional regulator